jgi:tetratricopeptide (TPR) repeat protein
VKILSVAIGVKNLASFFAFLPHNKILMLLNFVLETIRYQDLPLGVGDSPQHQVFFEKGKAALKHYHGQLGVLLESYSFFKQSSEAYCYMGLALMLTAASYDQSGYDREGLCKAVGYLDKAKVLPHDPLQLRLIESYIRACFDQLEKAHDLLDKLPPCLEVKMQRHALYAQELKQAEAEGLFTELCTAVQPERQKDLYTSMAWLYLKLNDLPKGLALLEQNLLTSPQDPWLNHTLSLFYFQLGDLQKTKLHNDKTLTTTRFPVALALRQELRKRSSYLFQRLLFRTGISLLVLTIGLRIVGSS